MKHLLRLNITLLAIMFWQTTVSAQGEYNYTTSNGTITITGYTGSGGAVAIPSTISGLPVTSIGFQAFLRNQNVTSVTIPNSVTNIGDYAFLGCASLTSVTIPNGVTSIGPDAFSGCTSLTSVTIPNGVTSIEQGTFGYCTSLTSVTILNGVTSIGGSAFFGCTSLTSVTIPSSVTSIGGVAFQGCTSLTNVTILNGVTSIGGSAFGFCTSLTHVTIPNSVTSIGYDAFVGCASLTSVTIPSSVTTIGVGAFVDCASLKAITVDAQNQFYSSVNGVLFDKSQTTLVSYPSGLAGSYTIPNSITNIGEVGFSDCTGLTTVTISSSVTRASETMRSSTAKCLPVSISKVTLPATGLNRFCSPMTATRPSIIGRELPVGVQLLGVCRRPCGMRQLAQPMPALEGGQINLDSTSLGPVAQSSSRKPARIWHIPCGNRCKPTPLPAA